MYIRVRLTAFLWRALLRSPATMTSTAGNAAESVAANWYSIVRRCGDGFSQLNNVADVPGDGGEAAVDFFQRDWFPRCR
jgi:hypothetical protein